MAGYYQGGVGGMGQYVPITRYSSSGVPVKGEAGSVGPQGPEGPQGPAGPPGADGTLALTQTINNGDTTHAASGDAVFDALALKINKLPTAVTDHNVVLGNDTLPFSADSAAANAPAAVNTAGIFVPGAGAGAGMEIVARTTSGTPQFYIRSFGSGSPSAWAEITHSLNFNPALKADDSAVLHKTGDETATGIKSLTSGIRSAVPADYWTSATGVYFGTEGYFGTNGSFAMSFRSNGYRNNTTTWTSLARGGLSGASGIDLRPQGTVRIGADIAAPSGFDITWRWEVSPSELRPFVDNAYSLGNASLRPSIIWAASGTISTSDAREKTAVLPLSPAELAASADLSRAIGTYQWLASIAEKGAENARHHVGMTVQRAIEIMAAHGLDPFRYGFICYDSWDELPEIVEEWPEEIDEDGNVTREAGRGVVQEYRPAGDRYSLRPDQLCLFLARGFDARLKALENK